MGATILTGALDLFRTGAARIGDCVVVPLLVWLAWQVFFGGTQPLLQQAWWIGLAGTLTWIALPGASRVMPLPMFAYAGFVLLSAAVLRWPAVSGTAALPWWELFRPAASSLVMIVVTLGIAHALRTPRRLAYFAALLCAAILVMAAQLMFDRTRTGFLYNEAGPGSMPTVAQWHGLHQVGVLFVIGVPLVLAAVVAPARWTSAAAALILALTMMTASFLNGSRSAILAGVLCAVLMLASSIWFANSAHWRKGLRVALLLAIPLATWYAFAYSSTSMRSISSLTAGRMPIWVTAVRIAADHPWIGVGPGNYLGALADGGYGERHLPRWGSIGSTPTHAHNQFLQVAAETGIPSLVCFVWMCGWMVRGCWMAAPAMRVRLVALGVMFAIVGIVIRANYDSIIGGIVGSDRISLIVWALFGAATALRGMAVTQPARAS
ncbi:MAG TPA: O-antigen ligase family protein [Vicinamibacterales bacterium]|nr:O-antigen ligase family protein [Vicinamibacterales bacterium]